MPDTIDPATNPLGAAREAPYIPDPETNPLGAAKFLPAGDFIPSKEPGVAPRSAEHHLTSQLQQERTWEEVAPELEKHGIDPKRYEQGYRLAEARAVQKGETYGYESKNLPRWMTSTADIFRRGAAPWLSAAENQKEDEKYAIAKSRYDAGKGSKEDAFTIARYENIKGMQAEQGKSVFGGLAQFGVQAPAIVGESIPAGKIAGALPIGGSLVGRVAQKGLAGTLMPSLWQEKMAQKNIEEGRPADDIRGLPPALGLAAAQNVVLGSLQNMFAGGGIKQAAKAGGVGVAEQAGADVLAGVVDEFLPKAYKTDTKYGTIGMMLDPRNPGTTSDALKHSLVQFLGFTAFAGLHKIAEPKELVQQGKEAIDAAKTPEEAAQKLQEIVKENSPSATPEEAAARVAKAEAEVAAATGPKHPLDTLSKDDLRDLATGLGVTQAKLREKLADPKQAQMVVDAVLGRRAPPESPEAGQGAKIPPPEPQGGPGEAQKPPTQTPAEGEIAPPAQSQEAKSVLPDALKAAGLENRVDKPLSDFFESGEHVVLNFGDRFVHLEHLPKENRVKIDFDKDAAIGAFGPLPSGEKFQGSSVEMFRNLKNLAEHLRDQGIGIEYTAAREPEVKPDEPQSKRDAVYGRMLQSLGFRLEGRTVSDEMVSAKWRAPRTGEQTPKSTVAEQLRTSPMEEMRHRINLLSAEVRDLPSMKDIYDSVKLEHPERVADVESVARSEGLSKSEVTELVTEFTGRGEAEAARTNPSLLHPEANRPAAPTANPTAPANRGKGVVPVPTNRYGVYPPRGPKPPEKSSAELRAAQQRTAEYLGGPVRRRKIVNEMLANEPEVPPPQPAPGLYKRNPEVQRSEDKKLLRARIARTRKIIGEALTNPTPENIARARGSVQGTRNYAASRGLDPDLSVQKNFPKWAAFEKSQAPRARPKDRALAMHLANAKTNGNEWLVGEVQAKIDGTQTVGQWVRDNGGISISSLKGHDYGTILKEAGAASGTGSVLLRHDGAEGTSSIDQLTHWARNQSIIPEHGTEEDLIKAILDNRPVRESGDAGDRMLAEHEAKSLARFKEETADVLRGEHPDWSDKQIQDAVEKTVRSGQADEEAANLDAEEPAQVQAAGATAAGPRGAKPEPTFDVGAFEATGVAVPRPPTPDPAGLDRADFGRPMTSAEKRTGVVGGGQENASGSEPPLKQTALANAITDKEREANRLPPLMAEARLANERVWDEAMSKIDADPRAETHLIDELSAKPRATTVQENALLLHRRIALSNEHGRAIREAIDGFMRKVDPAELDRLSAREAALMSEIDRLDQVIRKTGSEWGRAGQFRRQLAREDFSLSSMLGRAEIAKGSPLTPEEKAEIAAMHDKIRQLEAALAAAEAVPDLAAKKGEKGDLADMRIATRKAQQEYAERIAAFRYANLPAHKKIIRNIGETFNSARSIITAFDLSAVFRQGGFTAFSRPITAARAVPDMPRSFTSEHAYERSQEAIHQRANALLYEKAGLYLANRTGPLSAQEEAFIGRWTKRIPGVAGSERAYNAFLNRIRADVFDSMVGSLSRRAKPTDTEAAAIANFINVATGRGKLGAPGSTMEKAAVPLAHLFFSPRFVVSRFQLFTGQPLYGGSLRTRGLVASEYARALVGLGLFYAVASMDNDAKLTFDPRSTDFGKIRWGNTRLDPLAGLAQVAVFVARVTSGETKPEGKGILPLRDQLRYSATGKVPFGGNSVGDVIGRFVRSKMAPVPGAAMDVLTGKNVAGEPTTVASTFGNLAMPMSVRDVYESLTDQGVPRGAAIGLLAVLGMGTQTYEPKKAPKQTSAVERWGKEMLVKFGMR